MSWFPITTDMTGRDHPIISYQCPATSSLRKYNQDDFFLHVVHHSGSIGCSKTENNDPWLSWLKVEKYILKKNHCESKTYNGFLTSHNLTRFLHTEAFVGAAVKVVNVLPDILCIVDSSSIFWV